MSRRASFLSSLAALAVLAAALFAPIATIYSLQAGVGSVIEDSRKMSSGAGLVLVIGLQRG